MGFCRRDVSFFVTSESFFEGYGSSHVVFAIAELKDIDVIPHLGKILKSKWRKSASIDFVTHLHLQRAQVALCRLLSQVDILESEVRLRSPRADFIRRNPLRQTLLRVNILGSEARLCSLWADFIRLSPLR